MRQLDLTHIKIKLFISAGYLNLENLSSLSLHVQLTIWFSAITDVKVLRICSKVTNGVMKRHTWVVPGIVIIAL